MIVVVTSSRLGRILQHHPDTKNFSDSKDYLALQKWLEQNKGRLVPTFPETESENLQVYFQLQTETTLTQTDLNELLKLHGIEGAYEKPSEELPM